MQFELQTDIKFKLKKTKTHAQRTVILSDYFGMRLQSVLRLYACRFFRSFFSVRLHNDHM